MIVGTLVKAECYESLLKIIQNMYIINLESFIVLKLGYGEAGLPGGKRSRPLISARSSEGMVHPLREFLLQFAAPSESRKQVSETHGRSGYIENRGSLLTRNQVLMIRTESGVLLWDEF